MIYKIANRVNIILPYVVGPLQTSFIKGRNSVDNFIILQELVHSSEHRVANSGFMILKLDLQKGFR